MFIKALPALLPRCSSDAARLSRLAGSSLMGCHKTCSPQRRDAAWDRGPCPPGRPPTGLSLRTDSSRFQFRVSVYVGPDEDLKNKFRKSGSPTWFLLGAADPGAAVSLQLQLESAAPSGCFQNLPSRHLNPMFCFSIRHSAIFLDFFSLLQTRKSKL